MQLITPRHRFAFTGRGSDLFAVLIVNWLLTMLTLGLYYPWAKARRLQYYYEHTELDGHPLHFHGSGRELFVGFILAVGLLVLLYVGFLGLVLTGAEAPAFLLLFGGLLALVPLILHGTYRYRAARSSWRGIRFGYRGGRGALYSIFLRDGLLTVLTLGIYSSWFVMHLRNYVLGNLRWGSSRFTYRGDGLAFLLLNLKGYFLTLVTLGIYWFWWQRDLFHYHVDNLSWEFADGRSLRFKGKASGPGFMGLIIVNLLLVVLTLGIGYAWAEVRTMRFILDHVELDGDADLDGVLQTEQEQQGAVAEELGDLLDIGIFL